MADRVTSFHAVAVFISVSDAYDNDADEEVAAGEATADGDGELLLLLVGNELAAELGAHLQENETMMGAVSSENCSNPAAPDSGTITGVMDADGVRLAVCVALTVTDGVIDPVILEVGVTLPEGDTEELTLALEEPVDVADIVSVDVILCDADSDTVIVAVFVAVADVVLVTEGDAVIEALKVTVRLALDVTVAVEVTVSVAVGVIETDAVIDTVCVQLAVVDGLTDADIVPDAD